MWQMVFVLCACSQLHAVSLQEAAGKGEPLERTAGGRCGFGELRGLFGGEDSRAGRAGRRRVTVQPRRLQPTGTETTQRSSQQDPETTKWTSLGSEETGKVRCSSESHWAIQSYAYKQGSVSKDTMSRGESGLWNCFIFTLSDVVTSDFLHFKSWVTYGFFYNLSLLQFKSLLSCCIIFL